MKTLKNELLTARWELLSDLMRCGREGSTKLDNTIYKISFLLKSSFFTMAPIPNHLQDFSDLEVEESSAEESPPGDSDSNDLEYADLLGTSSEEEEG